jgi:outer membrane protein insertion porin family
MKRLLLPAVLAALMITEVHAESFTISDIRVTGLQRVSAGSVFGALPLNVGAEADDRSLVDATRELFKTGSDVLLHPMRLNYGAKNEHHIIGRR